MCGIIAVSFLNAPAQRGILYILYDSPCEGSFVFVYMCVCVTLYYSFIRLGRLFHVTCIIGIEANDAIHIIYVHWILFNNDNDAI